MSNGKKSSDKAVQVISSQITQILGSTPVLPGESQEVYQQGLVTTIQELGALTPLQIYLAEKIYECLWWMRRYEIQKRATLINTMAGILETDKYASGVSDLKAWVMDALYANRIDDEFKELLGEHNLTMETLTQKAMASSRPVFENLDQMIALNAKTLAGFQASFEVVVNRKVNAERMRLQNALMQRDLGAIENQPTLVESNNVNKGKRPKASGQ
jgi:hypothetical protein